MCHSVIALTREEVEAVIGALYVCADSGSARLHLPEEVRNAAHAPSADAMRSFPGDEVFCIGSDESALQDESLEWGISVDWKQGPIFNTRLESALDGNRIWQGPMTNGRIIVPSWRFFEWESNPTGKKRQFEFFDAESESSEPLLLAGVAKNEEMSIVTTAPNEDVQHIHDRMPLVLDPQEALMWLSSKTDPQAFRMLEGRSNIHLASRVLASDAKLGDLPLFSGDRSDA